MTESGIILEMEQAQILDEVPCIVVTGVSVYVNRQKDEECLNVRISPLQPPLLQLRLYW